MSKSETLQQQIEKMNADHLRQECVWQMIKSCDFDAVKLERFGQWQDAKTTKPNSDAGMIIIEADYHDDFGVYPGWYDAEYAEWTVPGDDLVEAVRWMPIPEPIPAEIIEAAKARLERNHRLISAAFPTNVAAVSP